jgi:Rap1a immunity proteins
MKVFALLVVVFASSVMVGENRDLPFKLDGMHLRSACDDTQASEDVGYCLGLMRGVTSLSDSLCASNITLEQARLVVLKFLRDNPEKLNQSDVLLVKEALEKAFPCRKTKP